MTTTGNPVWLGDSAAAYRAGLADGAAAVRQAALEYWRSKRVSADPDYLPRWFEDLLRDRP